MTTAANTRLELEQVGREALLLLFQQLNGAIDTQVTLWSSRDSAFWSALGRTNPNHTVEHIANENFYAGHVPSLIEAPIEKYPNCAVYCHEGLPRGFEDDDAEMFGLTLYVELMCKSVMSEEEVNARVHRTVEAAHAVMASAPGRILNNYVWGPMNDTPSVTIGDVFIRRAEKSRGDRWFWQGGRLQYSLDRYVSY